MKRPYLAMLLVMVLVLLGIGPAAPPPVRADDPVVFHGTARYTENGPGAGVDGIATALLVGGVGGGVVVARLQSMLGVLDALGSLGDNPTMQSIHEFLNSGVPVDLAGLLPVWGRYDATLNFTLVQQPDGAFTLQSGTVNWTVSNGAEISGDGTSIVDRFGGSGSDVLDPDSDVIRLEFDIDSDKPTFTLTVDIDAPTPTSGDSTWTAANGAIVLWEKARNGQRTMGGQVLGQEIPEEPVGGGVFNHGIYYSHTGPLSELQHMETWRNLLDAQVLIEYDIVDQCRARVTSPAENEKVTLPKCFACNLDVDMEANVSPTAWGEDLTWEMPEFGGQSPNYDPEDQQGATMHVWYEGPAPERNSAFGELEITTRFEEMADRCEAPEPHKIRVFFPHRSYNNPDGHVPNWYYYWTDTPAAQGHESAIIYDSACSTYGYYNGFGDPAEANHIYVCDIFSSGNPSTNPVTGKVTEGIDLFAATVLHEWTHLENRNDWWGATGYDAQVDAAGNLAPTEGDRDADMVKDSREAAYGLSPRTRDSLGLGFRDSEYPAYLQEDTWPSGSADKQDWADPGKQSGS
ncbi:MAG: hypothetical protein GX649_05375 [Chloroflexi bacterium]|nr:hypothetical protein [Chloroflexota bacterium]